ncbi:MAG TPA: hypothetical protein VM784_12040 [Actinomycetota bacterium]|nr:hypothetical protein [Actinomycetota bacterium]
MTETPEPGDMSARAHRELQLAREGNDETRLEVLESLLERLETELERDFGQAGTPRR